MVSIDLDAVYPLSSGVHEIGHALDALFLNRVNDHKESSAIPDAMYATEQAVIHWRGWLNDVITFAMRSRPIKEFESVMRSSRFGSRDRERAEYYFDPKEVWARAYQQFIAQNCRDANLRAEFHVQRYNRVEIGGERIRVFWTYREFAGLEREIRRVFRALGWI
jgi:hypothetical protein